MKGRVCAERGQSRDAGVVGVGVGVNGIVLGSKPGSSSLFSRLYSGPCKLVAARGDWLAHVS